MAMNLKQAVVFAILMENGDGILGKAPSYVWEKLMSAGTMEDPEHLLDFGNTAKLEQWVVRWKPDFAEKK